MYVLLLMTFLSCHSRMTNDKVPVELRKMSKQEIRDDWSLCVQGLINRLHEENCQKIDVKKFNDRVEIACTTHEEDRHGFWEQYVFHVKPPVLIKTGLNNINIARAAQYSIICIDQIQKVEAYPLETPRNERVKIKRRD